MAELLIGCPVLDRAWVLGEWFSHVERACVRAEVDPSFIFVGDPVRDPATWAVIDECAGPRLALPVVAPEPAHGRATPSDHGWTAAGYHRMVELRNELLREVRALAPQWFLSLDSDVLVHPDAIVQLLATIASYDAVGGKTFLTPGSTDSPSYAMVERGSLTRYGEFDGVVAVDIIMAVKLMAPAAYAVDYCWHHQGEDVGWSQAARSRGLRLGYNATVASKHVMDPAMLERVDARVGF